MRAKFLCFVALTLIAAVTFAFAAGNSFSWSILPNCESAGVSAENCDRVVGPVYKSSVGGEASFDIKIELPIPGFMYTREWVNCKSVDNTVIAGAYYSNGEWIKLPTEVDIKPDGKIFINITTKKLGTLAVITTDKCVPVSCGTLGSFNTDPFGAKAFFGKAITFIFCGIVPGCDLSPKKWTPQCAFPEPVRGQELAPCTADSGDCCLALKEGVCDADCWPAPGSEEAKRLDYVDPDCMNLKDNPGCYRNKIDTDPQKTEKCDRNCGDTDYTCNVTRRIECNPEAGNCCNPEIDGHCDADCPNITAGDKEYYLDPDCGILRGMYPTAADGDGCYPICDGICDNDCLPGIDPDCLPVCKREVIVTLSDPDNDYDYAKEVYMPCCIRDGDGICDNSMHFKDKFKKVKEDYEEKAKAAEEAPEEQGLTEEEKANYAKLSALYYKLASAYTLETPENAAHDCTPKGRGGG